MKPIEVRLKPGWLAEDVARAAARVDEWSGRNRMKPIEAVAKAIRAESNAGEGFVTESEATDFARVAIAALADNISDEAVRDFVNHLNAQEQTTDAAENFLFIHAALAVAIRAMGKE